MENKRPKPVTLIILDGFGIASDEEGNAITKAKTPRIKSLISMYPAMTLRASGEEVGLSWGEMGNSEVGHLTIGSGRVYYQTFPRINTDIANKSFFQNPAFMRAAEHVKKNKSNLHIIGLVSAGGVHGMDAHCYALLEFAKKQKIKNVFVHAILDGRDSLHNSASDFIKNLQKKMKEMKVGKIATMSGRFYAMDRDNRWDRTEAAYNAIVNGIGEMTNDPIEAIKKSYAKEIFDEEFHPTVITEDGEPIAKISQNDACIFFNFRPDRARQLAKAFVLPSFDKFKRDYIENLYFVTMAEYEKNLPVDVAYSPEVQKNTVSEIISKAGLKQLHIAETEKYAHMTFFFNGMREEKFDGEERILIPSPKVANYSKSPEMSAYEITERIVKEVKSNKHDFIVANFANADMVGHTGDLKATIKAVEATDECVGRIVDAVLERGGAVLITADHGNAEYMLNLVTGQMDKEHTINMVPFLVVGANYEGRVAPSGEAPGGDLSLLAPVGVLADVAPTILSIMNLKQPEEMSGRPLI